MFFSCPKIGTIYHSINSWILWQFICHIIYICTPFENVQIVLNNAKVAQLVEHDLAKVGFLL